VDGEDGQAGAGSRVGDLVEELLYDLERVLGPDHPDTLTTRGALEHWTLLAEADGLAP
jgi:hypothetical protein